MTSEWSQSSECDLVDFCTFLQKVTCCVGWDSCWLASINKRLVVHAWIWLHYSWLQPWRWWEVLWKNFLKSLICWAHETHVIIHWLVWFIGNGGFLISYTIYEQGDLHMILYCRIRSFVSVCWISFYCIWKKNIEVCYSTYLLCGFPWMFSSYDGNFTLSPS